LTLAGSGVEGGAALTLTLTHLVALQATV